ncbi:hypothetical protein RDWZM_001754 [Blomia tropicalis]|uniref:Protein SSUH2 homolog n=1 Tax=Blomia tropicalis TaxID=40697 RepID=A0A9Q0RQV6_BLOTA|nr:hypothetical protein RDWZM_001754 [Blomia tropicalis]
MSKYRRQSIYLQRKSLSRANSSIDPYIDESDHSINGMSNSTLALTNQPIPPPPNLESMKVIKGFEFVTFQPIEICPIPLGSKEHNQPLIENDDDDDDNERTRKYNRNNSITKHSSTMVKSFDLERMPDNISPNEITEEQARNALYKYVNDKFCYGTKAATNMTIRDMIHSYVFQYSLESFCEKRQLCWTYEPYADACISLSDNCCSGSVPNNAWNIEVNEIKHLEWYMERTKNNLNRTIPIVEISPSSPVRRSSSFRQHITTIPEIIIDRKYSQPTITTRYDMSQSFSSSFQPLKSSSSADDLFQNRVINVVVPGTVSIHSCHNCGGVGRKRCATCAGSGTKSCQTCIGHGYYSGSYHKSAFTKSLESGDYCWRCHGRGRLRCYNCNGDGMIICAACIGSGQIKCYIKMIVTLTNHQDTVLIRDHHSMDVPIETLNMADGELVFDEEGHNHVNNYIDESITRESQRLIKIHEDSYLRNTRLILQRHRIKVIPIVKVIAFWQRKQFHFHVFGSSTHRCYTADYPQNFTCSCCCIL